MKNSMIWAGLLMSMVASAHAQQLAPNAPKDKPVGATRATLSEFEIAIAPSIAEAKKTYPAARARYLHGLPQNHHFFVTTRLKDPDGRFEQVFVYVTSIDQDKRVITGKISSPLEIVRTYRRGQAISFPEDELVDWTVARPDGTEEGNYVGKFLDEYQKPKS